MIFILDDDPVWQSKARVALTRRGRIKSATLWSEVEQAVLGSIDGAVLICDLKMPELNLDFCRMVRREAPQVKLVVCSESVEEWADALKSLGAISLSKRKGILGLVDLVETLTKPPSKPTGVDQFRVAAQTLTEDAFLKQHPQPVLLMPGLVAGADPREVTQTECERQDINLMALPVSLGNAAKKTFTIGRAPECDLILEASDVSKDHARLSVYRGRADAFVWDIGSKYGTAVNGKKLTAGRKAQVTSGDEIQLGRLTMHFYSAQDFYELLRELPEPQFGVS